MAMTKRARVSFDIKAILPTDQEKIVLKELLALAKGVSTGEIKPDGCQRQMLTLWLTEGMDSVTEFVLRRSLRSSVKEALEEYSDSEFFKVSPATVRFK